MNRQQRRREERAQRRRPVLDPETRTVATPIGHHFKPGPLADLPEKVPGRHRWILSSAYTITDQDARAAMEGVRQVLMGADTLISFGVGCWDCEREYSQCFTGACTA